MNLARWQCFFSETLYPPWGCDRGKMVKWRVHDVIRNMASKLRGWQSSKQVRLWENVASHVESLEMAGKLCFQVGDKVWASHWQLDVPMTTWLSIWYCQTYEAKGVIACWTTCFRPTYVFVIFELVAKCVFGHIVSHFSFPTTSPFSNKVLSFSAQIFGCLSSSHQSDLFQGVAFAQQWSSAAAFGRVRKGYERSKGDVDVDVLWEVLKILYTLEST